MVLPIRQRNHPWRKRESHRHIPGPATVGENSRRLKIVAPIIARERFGGDHVLVISVHADVRQVFEQRDDLFGFAQTRKVLRVDVGPAAPGRIQDVGGLNVGKLGQELVEIGYACDDGLAVICRDVPKLGVCGV